MVRALSVICLGVVLLFNGCTPEYSDDAIPRVPFSDITIELTLPAYNSLKTNGGYKYISGGVKGIVVYRQSESRYVAFERNCSFHPNDACATVNVDGTSLFMIDPCCNSTFSFPEGTPSGGPAVRSLNRYSTSLSGTTLTITSDVIN